MPERAVALRLMLGEREMVAVVAQERRKKATALLRRHRREQDRRERRGLRQDGREIGVADGQLLAHDAAGERVGTGAAQLLGQGERAQSHLRGLVEQRERQAPVAGIQPIGLQGNRLDLLRDKSADGVADFQLLRAEVKIVHE